MSTHLSTARRTARIVAAWPIGALALLLGLGAARDASASGWTALTPLPEARGGHTSSLLPDGRVLVVGGQVGSSYTASTAIYRPATNTWTTGPAMSVPRVQHVAVPLRDGRVLVAGGQSVEGGSLASAEIYDPSSNTWSTTGSLATARRVHTAVLMADGRVLVNGGHNDGINAPLASAERFDPASGTWTALPDMSNTRHSGASLLLPGGVVLATGGFSGHVDRYLPSANTWLGTSVFPAGLIAHSLTLLGNGKVWLAGGYSGVQQFASHVYDPATNLWTPGPSLPLRRAGHQAALLPGGDVLLIGGNSTDTQGEATTVRYRPATNTVVAAESLSVARRSHAAVLMADGRVLVTGGYDNAGALLASVEAYDDATPTFTGQGSMNQWRIAAFTTTRLADGQILVVGGNGTPQESGLGYTRSGERYNTATGTWHPIADLPGARVEHAAVRLPDGRVLITGGVSVSSFVLTTGLVYDPGADTWTPIAPDPVARYAHTLHLLPDGRVLAVGGTQTIDHPRNREIYDPTDDQWSLGSPGIAPRNRHAAVRLFDGRILVAGGRTAALTALEPTAEVFDPATGAWSPAGTLVTPRLMPVMTLLADGRVLMTCGSNATSTAFQAAEIYDPASNTWTATGAPQRYRSGCAAILLPDGRVLVSGGNGTNADTSAELFDPRTGTWSFAGNLLASRSRHHAQLLPDGRAMLIGGGPQAFTYEIFEPQPQKDLARVPTLGALPPSIRPGTALSLFGTGFQPPHAAHGGSTSGNRGNLPFLRIYQLDTGMLRSLPIDRSQPFTDTALTTIAGATSGLTPGPAIVDVRVNGLPSAPRPVQIASPLPGAPTSVVAMPGDGMAHLTFQAPADNGGSPITGYQVTTLPGGARVDCGVSCTNGLLVFNLTNGTPYTFVVRARNSVGRGAASAPSAPITPSTTACNSSPLTLAVAVEQPVSCHAGTNGALRATPSGGAGPYLVWWSPGGSMGNVLSGVGAGNYTATVSDALNCTRTASITLTQPQALTVQTSSDPTFIYGGSCEGVVRATAGGGTAPYTYRWPLTGQTTPTAGAMCAGVHPVTVTDANQCSANGSATVIAPPSAPRNLTVTPGDQRVTVNFDPPLDTGGGDVGLYQATCGPRTINRPSIAPPPFDVPFLTNGVAVTCSVRAINLNVPHSQFGPTDLFGPPTPPSASVTPAGVPGTPLAPTAQAGDGQIRAGLGGPPPNDNGAPITAYRFTASPGDASAECAAPCSDGATINGLGNGTTYTVTVQAINAAGIGGPSDASAAVTPRAPQLITFGPAPELRIGTTATLSATGGASGNPVVFQSSTPQTCTTGGSFGSSVTGVAVGTCTVMANQDGTAAFEPAPTATLNLDVRINQFRVTPSVLGAGTIAPSVMQWVDAGSTQVFTLTPPQPQPFSVEGTCGGTLTDNTFTTAPVTQDCTVVARFIRAPAAIADFTLVPLNAALRAEFTAPDDGGSAILDYQLFCSEDAQVVGAAPPIVLGGLTNNQVYRCNVRARNAAGAGPPSASRWAVPGTTGNTSDLSIVIDNGTSFVNGALPVLYTITVTNAGPSAALGVLAEDGPLPPEFASASWTCHAPPAANCRQPAAGGSLNALLDLPVGVPVELRYTAVPAMVGEPPLSMTVSVVPPVGIVDPNLADNVDSDGPDLQGVFRDGFE